MNPVEADQTNYADNEPRRSRPSFALAVLIIFFVFRANHFWLCQIIPSDHGCHQFQTGLSGGNCKSN